MVEEGERRSLKTESIPSTVVKWFLLWNTDKAWACISIFICVQGICLIFSTPYFLPPQACRVYSPQTGQVAGGVRFSRLLSQHLAAEGDTTSRLRSAPGELSAHPEQ